MEKAAGEFMFKTFFASQIKKNKIMILVEVEKIDGLMALLTKPRNTGIPWTPAEIRQLKGHLVHLLQYIPVLIIALLPGGFFLLPILAEALDRRKEKRL